jgi:prophage regulatory protein
MSLQERRLRRMLRLPEVLKITGLRRTAIYEGVATGRFPRPVPLGLRAVGWDELEVIAWLNERIAIRDTRTVLRSLGVSKAKPDA